MQLSKKQENFTQFFDRFPKSTSKFESFENEDNTHRLCISEIIDYERRG